MASGRLSSDRRGHIVSERGFGGFESFNNQVR